MAENTEAERPTASARCFGMVQILLPGPLAAAYCSNCDWVGPVRKGNLLAIPDANAHTEEGKHANA